MRASVGVAIHCEGGAVVMAGHVGTAVIAFDKKGKQVQKWSGLEDHFANFIKAVRSRKKEDLHADILEGHLSSALCHTGNISCRLGALAAPGAVREQFRADHDAAATFDRMVEHLSANGVDLPATKATLGAVLRMAPKSERFLGNDQANELLARNYCPPFVVPEKV